MNAIAIQPGPIPHAVWACPTTDPADQYTQTVDEAVELINREFVVREFKDRVLHVWRLLDRQSDMAVQKRWFKEVFSRIAAPSLVIFDDERPTDKWNPSLTYGQKQRQHKEMFVDVAKIQFRTATAHLNYGEFQYDPKDRCTDMHGHPFDQDIELVGDISSPVVYNWGNGNKFRHRYPDIDDPKSDGYQRMARRLRWESLIDQLNVVRSCLKVSPNCIPWVASPMYVGDHISFDPTRTMTQGQRVAARWWWETAIRHMAHMGVNQCIYWNGPGATDDNLHAAAYFKEAQSWNTPRLELPMVDLDAEEIVTGPVRTTLAQFLDHEHIPIAGEV